MFAYYDVADFKQCRLKQNLKTNELLFEKSFLRTIYFLSNFILVKKKILFEIRVQVIVGLKLIARVGVAWSMIWDSFILKKTPSGEPNHRCLKMEYGYWVRAMLWLHRDFIQTVFTR